MARRYAYYVGASPRLSALLAAARTIQAMKALYLLAFILVHDDYPMHCCNGTDHGGDCHPVNCDSITETKQGYGWEKFHFRPDQAYPSFNRECHVCVFRGAAPLCIFIQPSS
jgi:hypothetical protein